MGIPAEELRYRSEELDFIFSKQYLEEQANNLPIDEKLPSWMSSNQLSHIGLWENYISAKRMESFGGGHNMIIRVSRSHEEWVNIMAENKTLKKQVYNLNELLDEKDSLLNKWLEKYIDKSLKTGQSLVGVLFELYGDGLVTISQVKEITKISQYDFVRILAQKNMSFIYPDEGDLDKETRIKKLISLSHKE